MITHPDSGSCVAFTDRNTFTIGTSFKLVTCNSLGLGLNENADCLICKEGQYCQPYIDTDRFTFQLVSNHVNEPNRIEFYDLTGNIIFYTSNFYEWSWCEKDNVYTINLSVNMEDLITNKPLLPLDCFYIKIIFDELFIPLTEYEVITQPFCKIKCDEFSIEIDSIYNKYDCNGSRYESITNKPVGTCNTHSGGLTYANRIRLKGMFYYDNYSMDTTISDTFYTLNKKVEDTYIFESHDQLPEWMVRKFKACIMGDSVMVRLYKGDTLISEHQNLIVKKGTNKNNENGLKWTLRQEFSKICEISNIC